MKTLKLVPSTPDFKFVRHNRRAFVVSSVLIIGSLVAFLMQGKLRHRLQGRYSG